MDDAHAGITTDMETGKRWTIKAFDTSKSNNKETPLLEYEIAAVPQRDNEYHTLIGINRDEKVAALCAWCDPDKSYTGRLKKQGWKTTHGICKKHMSDILKEGK